MRLLRDKNIYPTLVDSMGGKSAFLPNRHQLLVLKPVNEITFLIKLKCQRIIIILSLGIKDSMRDLTCDVN